MDRNYGNVLSLSSESKKHQDSPRLLRISTFNPDNNEQKRNKKETLEEEKEITQ